MQLPSGVPGLTGWETAWVRDGFLLGELPAPSPNVSEASLAGVGVQTLVIACAMS